MEIMFCKGIVQFDRHQGLLWSYDSLNYDNLICVVVVCVIVSDFNVGNYRKHGQWFANI